MIHPESTIRYYNNVARMNKKEGIDGATLFYENHVFAPAVRQWLARKDAARRIKDAIGTV